MTAPLLRLSGVTKSFGTTRALSEVDLDVAAGEAHALVGENGAGKSTLLGILAGVVAPDTGRVEIDGTPVVIDGAARAQALGIGTVFQELSLADSLSVAENIFVGRLPTVAGVVRWGELRRRAREILSALAIDVDVDRAVDSLPAGARQLVEIAKALSLQSRILLLDEPTSALTAEEAEALLRLVGRLKANGIGIVYVSHKLGEVFQIADRITVLRDGRKVSSLPTALTSADAVVHDMVGHHLTDFVEASGEVGAVAVAARGLGRPGEFAEVDLTVRFGEIVGIAGLLGARRSELARTLSGILAPHHGSIEIRGHMVRLRSLRDAMRRGIAYVPEERKTDGLFLTRSVSDNLAAAALERFTRVGLIDGRAMRIAAERTLSRFHVRAPSLDAEAGRLSGGNQQKLMLSKWLEIDPAIVVMNEPTKGVDVESKHEIHHEIRTLRAAGKALLIVSSDLPELLALTDRIIVMREGRVVGALETRSTSEEQIMGLASGATRRMIGEAA